MEKMPGINGFYGATSMERLPVERGITEQVRKFTHMKNLPIQEITILSFCLVIEVEETEDRVDGVHV